MNFNVLELPENDNDFPRLALVACRQLLRADSGFCQSLLRFFFFFLEFVFLEGAHGVFFHHNFIIRWWFQTYF